MASPGVYTRPTEWWKHLRGVKRTFWKRERKAAARDALAQAEEELADDKI